jgi:hypothetical protein
MLWTLEFRLPHEYYYIKKTFPHFRRILQQELNLTLALCRQEKQRNECMEDQGEQEEAIALEHIIAQQRNALAEAKVVGLILPFLFFLSSLRSIFCESLLVSGYKW